MSTPFSPQGFSAASKAFQPSVLEGISKPSSPKTHKPSASKDAVKESRFEQELEAATHSHPAPPPVKAIDKKGASQPKADLEAAPQEGEVQETLETPAASPMNVDGMQPQALATPAVELPVALLNPTPLGLEEALLMGLTPDAQSAAPLLEDAPSVALPLANASVAMTAPIQASTMPPPPTTDALPVAAMAPTATFEATLALQSEAATLATPELTPLLSPELQAEAKISSDSLAPAKETPLLESLERMPLEAALETLPTRPEATKDVAPSSQPQASTAPVTTAIRTVASDSTASQGESQNPDADAEEAALTPLLSQQEADALSSLLSEGIFTATATSLPTPAPTQTPALAGIDKGLTLTATSVEEAQSQVVDGIQKAYSNQQQSLTVHMTPEHLGRVVLRLKQEGEGQVSARLMAESPEAAKLLASDLGGLKQQLQKQGIELTHVSIDVMPFELSAPSDAKRSGDKQQEASKDEARSQEASPFSNSSQQEGEAAQEGSRFQQAQDAREQRDALHSLNHYLNTYAPQAFAANATPAAAATSLYSPSNTKGSYSFFA